MRELEITMAMTQNSLRRWYDKARFWISINTTIWMLISGWTTRGGLLSWGVGEILADAGAVASAMMASVIWWVAYRIFPEMMVRRLTEDARVHYVRLATFFGSLILAAIVIFFLSTYLSIMGVGGAPAMSKHFGFIIEQASKLERELNEQLELEQSDLAFGIKDAHAQFTALEEEARGGADATGAAGCGAICLTAMRINKNYGDLFPVIEESGQILAESHEASKAALDEMNRIAYASEESMTSEERVKAFVKQLDVLNEHLGRMQRSSIIFKVDTKNQKMVELSQSKESSGDATLGALQDQDKAKILAALVARTGMIGGIIAKVRERQQKLDFKYYQMIKPDQAVWQYAGDIPSLWAFSIAADHHPMLFLVIFISFLSLVRREEEAEATAAAEAAESTPFRPRAAGPQPYRPRATTDHLKPR